MNASRRVSLLFSAILVVFFGAQRAEAQCVSLTTLGSAATQNFDTLSNTAGSTTNNLTITGWFMTETGGGARDNEQYAVDTGGSNTGDTFSYGSAASTDRALGGLQSGTLIPVIGACFTNNTGATITNLDVGYTGEEWRLGTAARTDQINFAYSTDATSLVTGSWTGVGALNFVTPVTATTGAKDGNAAANRTVIAPVNVPALSIANGATFWIRWTDTNAGGADDGLAVDDFSLTPQGGVPNAPVVPTCATPVSTTVGSATTSGVSATDADGTVVSATITSITPSDPGTITLTGFTPAGGVGGTANATLDVSAATPANSYTVTIQWANNDGSPQTADCVVTVNVNAPVVITPIHDIQGPGTSSPIVGSNVNIVGIVTGVKSNGFFVQEEDADADADPATSEGIFVFTSGVPPAAAAFTAQVQVNGTVVEFVPTQDPQQPPVTELSSPTVTQLAAPGQPLPAAIPLTSTFPDPAGPHDQLERVEGMRVSAASITVTGPSDGSFNESAGTGTSNGRFHGVITGVPRPFREAGIQAPDAPPSGTGTIPPIPRWDSNPERLRIESATINAQPVLTVKTSDVVGPVTGPLDYGFRGYAIYPDGTLGTPVVTPGTLPFTTVTVPAANELTVASFNLQRLFDTVNDPGGDPVLTLAAYNNRLAKASIAIRDHLRNPDIIGVQEVEKLAVLQDLAAKILTDGGPDYDAYLTEGNDVGGIDVGFLVKTDLVTGGVPRVAVNSVTQVNGAETWIDPDDGNPALLNDRPPLVLDAIVNRTSTTSYPIIVIVNHLRSLIGIESEDPDGLTTEGDRVRRKRQTQADSLAAYIQGRQTTTPGEHIVVIGDFNAFDVNDGFADVMSTILGTPPPDNETAVCSTCPSLPNTNDGVDQVNPNFVNLVNTPIVTERYSYVHEGNAQNIDHALISAGVVSSTTAQRIEHPRINADYPETERNNNATAFRISDHDPVVAFLAPGVFAIADLVLTKTDSPDPVNAGNNLTYTITVTNNGPDAAASAAWNDTIAGTTFVSLSAVAGWSCTTPAVGAAGAINCTNPSFGVGNAVFTLTVAVNPSTAAGTVLSNTATVTSATTEGNSGDESDTETTTVSASADLQLSKTDSPDPVNAGSNISYQLTLTNNGPSNAATATLSDTLPAGTTFVSLSTTGPWTCTTPAVGATGTVSCSNPSFGVTVDFFTLVVAVDPSTAAGASISNSATIASATSDPNSGNETGNTETTVATSADLSVTKSDSPDPVNAGANLTYTITVNNAGPSNASTVTLTDILPAETLFVSLAAPAGWSCTTPGAFTNGTVTCNAATVGLGNHVFTLVVNVLAATTSGTVINNSATVLTNATADPNSGNETGTSATTVATSANMSVTKTDSPDPVNAGSNITYSITVTNAGPSNADSVTLSDTLPAGTTFVSFTNPLGWTCTTPAVGATGTVSCSKDSSQVAGTATPFTLVVAVDPSVAAGTVISNSATAASTTPDPTPGNETGTATTTVATSADLSVTKTDSPDPVVAGANLTYTITVNNAGPSNAATASLSDTLPANTTFVSLSSPAGWLCTTPAVGASGTVSCSNASLAPGNAVFTLVVAVDPSTASGTILSNTATVSSPTDSNALNDSDTETTAVTASADLSVTKVDTPDPVTAGTNLTYTITVNNAGPSTALTPTLADTLPAGTTFVSLSTPAGWSCTTPAVGGTGAISCSAASLLPGNAVFTLVVNVDGSVADGTIITNTATAASPTDSNAANDSGTATTTVGTGSADLSVTKTDSPDPVTPGTNLTYTITVNNAGPSNATSATLSDNVPADTTFVSLAVPAGWSCTTPAVGGTGAISCNTPSMTMGSAVFTLVVAVSPSVVPPAVITNTANVSSATTDPNPGNESAIATTTVGTGSADLSVTKSDSPDPVTPGTNITYTITVNNAGPSGASTLSLSDTLPAGTTFVSLTSPGGWSCTTPAVGASGTISCTNANMSLGNNVFTLVVATDPSVAPAAVISNTATVSSATADPNTGNESGTATTTVGLGSAEVSVTKVDTPDPVSPGTNLTYTITATNAGPSEAAGATLSDTVPAGTTFVSLTSPAGWTCTTPAVGGTGAVSCSNSSMALGSALFTLVVNVDASATDGTVITNTATFTSTSTDPTPGNESATATTTVDVDNADLSITKIDDADPVSAGSNLTYTLTVNNAGPDTATNVTVDDTLPAQTTFVSIAAPAGWSCTTPAVGATGTVSCSNPSMIAGNAVFTLVVNVASATPAGTVITNTATVVSATSDPATGNESDTETTNVISPASVTGTKTASGTFTPGSTVTYTIVLSNAGSAAQSDNPGNEFTDVLPSQLTLLSASATSGTAVATVGTNTVTWNGSIAAGSSVTITIQALLEADVAPGTTVSNQGTISFDADGNGTNESSGFTGGAPTSFVVAAPTGIDEIPALDGFGLAILAAILAALGLVVMRRT